MRKLLLLLVVFLLPVVAQAQSKCSVNASSGNATTLGTLDLKAAMYGIAYQVCYSGDANTNNSVILQYRVTGSGTWINAYTTADLGLTHTCTDPAANLQNYNPTNDRRATISGNANAYYQQFRGSIIGFPGSTNGIQPGTSYDVQAIVCDPDNTNSTAGTVMGTISTASLNPPTGTTIQVNNNTDWSNALTNAGGVSAGKHVHINAAGGPYTGNLTLTSSGSSGSYTVIDCDATNPAHISSGATNGLNIGANFVVVENCIVDSVTQGGFVLNSGHHDVYIVGNTVTAFDTSCINGGGIDSPAGVDIHAGGNNIWVLNNILNGAAILTTCNTAHAGAGNASGVYIQGADTPSTGSTNVSVTGNTSTGQVSDGISLNSGSSQPHEENIEIVNNNVRDYSDDGIEFKVMSINGRGIGNVVIGNYASTCFAGNSNLQNGQSYGPLYFTRNTCYYSSPYVNTIYKLGNSVGSTPREDGPIISIHNSVADNHPSGGQNFYGCQVGGGAAQQGIWSFNNTYLGSAHWVSNCYANAMAGSGYVDNKWDYNDIDTTGVFGEVLTGFNNNAPSNLTAWKANGVCCDTHSTSADPTYTTNTGNFILQNGSPAIDTGVIIYNFNDANSAWPYAGSLPDMGALETGTPNPPPANNPRLTQDIAVK